MKGQSEWGYKPYTPLNRIKKRKQPYICRIAPGEDSIEFEWFDKDYDGRHFVNWRSADSGDAYEQEELTGHSGLLRGLKRECDYDFFITRAEGEEKSDVRLARTGSPVGRVVNYLHPRDEFYSFSGRYLCSPSLVKLPSGALLASMDVFAGHGPQNLSLIFRSDDNGITWKYVTDLFPCFWGKLFCHKGELYMLANSTEYGSLIIGKSTDEGRTWTAPVTLLPGAGRWTEPGPHKAPMPVIGWEGRLYTAIDYGSWESGGHGNGLLSIDGEADLLISENWSCTEFLPFQDTWEGAAAGKSGGALEGNAVVGPDGEIYNVLRYQMYGCTPSYGKALVLKGNKKKWEEPLEFAWFADFNGGSNSKYDLLYDEQSGAYWAIVSEVVEENHPSQRNVLSLAVSKDLRKFRIVKNLLDFRLEDPDQVGFQYVSFIIDGKDILYLSRSAFNKAHNMHDSNYITFHRIENFREVCI